MENTLKIIEKIMRTLIFITIAVMIIAVTTQVFARTFLPQAPIWTEEMSRFTLLFIAGFGAGLAVLSGDLVNVDLALMMMPKSIRGFFEKISALLVAAFGFAMIPASLEYTESGMWQTSPTLAFPMHYVFISMTFLTTMLGFYGVIKFLRLIGVCQMPVQNSH